MFYAQERSLNLTSKQSLEAIKKAVCMAFNDWYDCEIIDLDSGAAIVLDAEYTSLVIDFESREVALSNPSPSTLDPTLTLTLPLTR